MVNNSTNINKRNKFLSSQIGEHKKKDQTYANENTGHDLRHDKFIKGI
jgi:hypothetical protein